MACTATWLAAEYPTEPMVQTHPYLVSGCRVDR